jgi:predicted DNA-binding protein YlxM (UPF0122 family)
MTDKSENPSISEDYVKIKFSFTIPDDQLLSYFNENFPSLQFNIQSLLPLPNVGANCLLQVKGDNLDAFWAQFSEFYAQDEYNLVFREHNSLLFNVFIKDPWILRSIMEYQLSLLFPIKISGGIISIDSIAPRSNLNKMFQNPEWKELKIEVNQIRKSCSDSLLSQRQAEILDVALKVGYFDIPRKKSLSELAGDLGLSPSALSENLRRISKKLAECYTTCIEVKK